MLNQNLNFYCGFLLRAICVIFNTCKCQRISNCLNYLNLSLRVFQQFARLFLLNQKAFCKNYIETNAMKLLCCPKKLSDTCTNC